MRNIQALPAAPDDALADGAWKKIMVLAERYALIVQAYGGSATLATPAAQRDADIRNKCLRMVRFREETRSQRLAEKENPTMAKKTRNSKRNTDGDDLIDDDAASVAVAEKPERKARETTKKQDANQRKTGPAASKRAEAKAAKAGKEASKAKPKAGKAAATAKQTATSKKPKAKSKATSKSKASSGKRPRTTVEHKAPKAGSKFTAKYKGKTYTMTVKTVKGETVYVVKGKAYKSPSSAALVVVNRERGPNGWTFWSIE